MTRRERLCQRAVVERATVDIPTLVDQAEGGDAAAAEALFVMAYEQLRRLARARLRDGGRDAVLDTTALVHESYLRIVGGRELSMRDRSRFMHYASRAMRSVIVDNVRRRQAARRGGEAEHVALTANLGGNLAKDEDGILRVHEALDELATLDERLARVVEMRWFAGMTEREIAEVLGLAERTVRRDWEKARLLLARALR
ncbi:ECF-type sigma factor [Opitutales bacterium ASA1]|nr:ECF-type sigma factor [Opitutales bacterium ASA1]